MADFTGNTKEALNENDFRVLSTREKILAYSAGFVPPEGKTEAECLEELRLIMNNKTEKKTISLRPWLLAAAAVFVAAILILPAIRLADRQKVATKLAEQKDVTLPDGSTVTLNAGSRMTWSERSFLNRRTLKLDGEAFMKVQKGKEFVITTPNGRIEILGTELNIFSRGTDFRVSCISGKVAVEARNQKVVLSPGEYTKLSGNELVKHMINNPSNDVSWRRGEFYFEDQPLISIFDEIERQFNVSIKSQGIDNRFFTGNFSNKNLKEALDIVCIPMNLNYDFKEGSKVVSISPK